MKSKSFFGFNLFSEYKNVSWPNKERILNSLWVVFVFVIVMSVLLGFFDFLLTQFFNWIFGLK